MHWSCFRKGQKNIEVRGETWRMADRKLPTRNGKWKRLETKSQGDGEMSIFT